MLIRDKSEEEIATKHAISIEKLENTIQNSLTTLKEERAKREKPEIRR